MNTTSKTRENASIIGVIAGLLLIAQLLVVTSPEVRRAVAERTVELEDAPSALMV